MERVAQIYWRMEKFKIEMDADAPGEGLVLSACSRLPFACLEKQGAFIWHVRWASQGLTGVKPVILFSHDITVPPGKAVEISAS